MTHRRRALPILLALIIAVAAGIYLTRPSANAGQVTASGTVEVDEVGVAAEAPGRVVELAVDEGARVTAGQVVARIDDSTIQVQLRQADPAQRQLLESQLDKLTLRAPLAGIVMKRFVNRGEVVAAGVPVLTVANPEMLKLTLYVPERELGRVYVGQSVQVHADPFPGRAFVGDVQSIATRAEFTPRNVQTTRDRQALVFAIKIRVPNPGAALKAGLPVDATFDE